MMVDRFSSLPNELLDLVFDHTYTSSPPSKPLSKRFLPFYRIHLYRSIHLSSPRQLASLLRTIKAKKDLGHLVSTLIVSEDSFYHFPDLLPDPSEEILLQLLPLLPYLSQLAIPEFEAFERISAEIGHTQPLLAGLTSLSLPPPSRDEEAIVELDSYTILRRMHGLTELRVTGWGLIDDTAIYRTPTTSLPGIKTLHIEGEGAEDSSCAQLLEVFPSIENLTLHTTYMDANSWSEVCGDLPSELVSLTLLADHPRFSPADALLLPLQALKRIHLGRSCFSSNISGTFKQLPLLEKIHLGDGPLDAKGFLSLVTGPSRLTHLRHLVLDLDHGSFGPCIKLSGDEVSLESNDDGSIKWHLPVHFVNGDLDRLYMTRLIEAARSSGIRVEGTVLKALQVLKLHCIDSNNRAILAYSGPADLRRLHKIRMEALRCNYQLPEFDFDSLERNKLEIVETKLEGSEWSVFGFKEREK